MREPALAALLVFFAACDIPSDAPTEPKTDNASPPVQKPRDETRRFPSQDRIRVEVIDDQILGKEFLPGGNLAFYERNGKKWRQFLVEADSATTAALLLNDYRAAMTEPKYLAHMGGYFGKDGNDDVLVLQKGSWVMGVVGLAEKDADIMARGSAAWLD